MFKTLGLIPTLQMKLDGNYHGPEALAWKDIQTDVLSWQWLVPAEEICSSIRPLFVQDVGISALPGTASESLDDPLQQRHLWKNWQVAAFGEVVIWVFSPTWVSSIGQNLPSRSLLNSSRKITMTIESCVLVCLGISPDVGVFCFCLFFDSDSISILQRQKLKLKQADTR